METKSFWAAVEFSSPHALSDLAARLNEATGIALSFDESGRYDEVPAFVAEIAGLDVSLLGVPEEHQAHESVLKVRLRTELSFEAIYASLPSFFRCVLVDKGVDARGFINCSSELAKALLERGFADCLPVGDWQAA